MRFSVQKKIVLLGAGLSFLLMVAAFLTSFFMYKSRSQQIYINSIDLSINELEESIADDSTISDMKPLVAKVLETYIEHYNDEIPEFKTLDEKYDYYMKRYSAVYPTGMLDLSQIKLKYQNTYLDISASLNNASISAGTKIAYAGVILDKNVTHDLDTSGAQGDEGRLIYMFDSLFRFGNTKGNFLGTDYKFTTKDNDVDPTSGRGEYIINGRNARCLDIYLGKFNYLMDVFSDSDLTTYPESLLNMDVYVTAFIEYDLSILVPDQVFFAIIEGVSLLIVLIILVISYILIARFTIVKNIVKLTSSTKEFTNNIKGDKEINVIDPDIKSSDEIGNLSESFVLLENEIISYAERIEYESKERERINTELSVASKIQLEALPKPSYSDMNITFDSSITSAKEVGGDFYDYFYIDNDNFAIIISDVSGKGVPAALFMMRGKELIKSKLLSKMKLENVCYTVNNELLSNNEEGLFITSFIGIYNIKTDELSFVNCGHEKPFLVGSEVVKLETNSNFILGGVENFKYQKETIKLGDNRLFLYTDGLSESVNDLREEFSYDGIKNTLEANKDNTNTAILENMITELNKFSTCTEQFDDITMIVFNPTKKEISLEFENPGYEIIETIVDKINNNYSFLDNKVKSEVAIIFDEMLNNYISYEKQDNLFISINTNIDNNYIYITLKNNGDEFNPLERSKKYIESEEDITGIGGFGITIVRNLVDDIKYKRENNFNILSMKKKIKE